MEKNEFVDNA